MQTLSLSVCPCNGTGGPRVLPGSTAFVLTPPLERAQSTHSYSQHLLSQEHLHPSSQICPWLTAAPIRSWDPSQPHFCAPQGPSLSKYETFFGLKIFFFEDRIAISESYNNIYIILT